MLNNSIVEIAQENLFTITPVITSVILVTLILATIYIIYYFKLKKVKENEAPKGLVLIMQMVIAYIRSLVVEILGPKLEKLTPYFIYLFSYILLSNVIGLIGFENPTGSLTVTLSMGFVTFIGLFVIGFKYQKISYLKKFCICIKVKGKKIPVMVNPLEVISQITPFISISFRLWGNIFAGSLITSLWFFFTGYISCKIPVVGVFNILGTITIPPVNIYFDLLCGLIQALVFTLLTMVYWTLEKGEGVEETKLQKVVIHSNANI